MLTSLHIRDFAIIDALELELRPGLTVVTGETGAGKSIVVDALQLIAGGRGGAELIRHGAERAEVAATFDMARAPADLKPWLNEHGIALEPELSVRRAIMADGRSRAWLNGQLVALQQLRELGDLLIDIHGQHEFQSLARSHGQRLLLDGYGRLTGLAAQVAAAHRTWSALLERTLDLESRARDREARLDLLRYQAQELSALALGAEELARLREEAGRFAHGERLARAVQTAVEQLYEGEEVSAHAALARAQGQLRSVAGLDPRLHPLLQLLDGAAAQLTEGARELRQYLDGLSFDEERRDQVERRLAAAEDLARKHRVAPEELPRRAAELATELAGLENAEGDLAQLREQLAAAVSSYRLLARQLTAGRVTAGRALSKEVTAHMQELGMAGGRLQVEVTPLESAEPSPTGADQIDFRVTANPGQPPRALAKVASGGELARLSLAVQVACAGDQSRCMVFDEVDAGIGGAIAEIVGRELRRLAQAPQVLCVTHLAQVASQGHQHLRVTKETTGSATRTRVAELSHAERVNELARMLGGVEITERAREHAREMLESLRSPASGTRSSRARSARTE
ncbi:MAG TPA: DNA repair protein RecN [Steroidobacteraceae bacterium]|nr:DNA repair protein RecN [Steroidobacteraceae bacterium]